MKRQYTEGDGKRNTLLFHDEEDVECGFLDFEAVKCICSLFNDAISVTQTISAVA
jgi:hypothetical protein